MPKTGVSIYNFNDYRTFLKEAQGSLKKSDSKYSHRFIGERVGASSAGWFSNVISGRISLTGAYRIKLCSFLDLSTHEADYFNFLVGYEQASTIEEKRIISQKIVSHKGVKPLVVGKDQFEFYSHWYISAVRELLFIYDFKDNYKELSRMLIPQITVSETKSAIRLLKEMQLIKLNEDDIYRPAVTTIENDSQFIIVHWANQMIMKGQLGVEAVSRFHKDERNISEIYVPLSQESYSQVVADIESFRLKVLALSAEDHRSDRIYQCNIQLFPLSKTIEKE